MRMVNPVVRFPAGRYYALTWGIADDFGGMTSALLHRSRAFRRLGGVNVEVLTLDDRPDYAELSAKLLAAGELTEGVSIRNLWDDLRLRELRPAKRQSGPVDAPEALAEIEPVAAHGDDRVIEHGGVVLLRERRDESGEVVGVDRFRRDGSLLATERYGDDGYSVVLFDAEGQAVRRWGSRWKLYRWWLDQVFKKRLSFLIIDSKTAARFVPGYRRENVVTLHLVHASHRRPAEEALLGIDGLPAGDEKQPATGSTISVLRPSREKVLKQSNSFDSIVVLTERQREELVSDLADLGIDARAVVRVIPNGIDLPPAQASAHTRGSGIVVASLDERKRVELAVDAVVVAHSQSPEVTLDVYGSGERADAIREQVAQQHAEGFVALHGYQPDARSHFTQAEFCLLTSSNEGLPLVLVESMAAGCIPIAFDIRYGPADMIRNGVSGFLVPEGDTEQVAQRILELQRMSDSQLQVMRNKAVAKAQEFSDEAVAKRWAKEFERALGAKRIRDAADQPVATQLRRRAGNVRRRVRRVLGR